MTLPQLIVAVLALGAVAYVLLPLMPRRGDLADGGIAGGCPACGPRPERDARYCSNRGRSLNGRPR